MVQESSTLNSDFIFLVETKNKTLERLLSYAVDDEKIRFESVESSADLNGHRPKGEIITFLIGSDVADPIQSAQRLHAYKKSAKIILLAKSKKSTEALKQAVKFTPFLGMDVFCLDGSRKKELEKKVYEILQDSMQAEKYRDIIGETQSQMSLTASSQQPVFNHQRFISKLMDIAPVGIAIIGQEGTVLGWNQEASSIFKKSETEVLGKPLSRLFGYLEADKLEHFLMDSFRERETGQKESLSIERNSADTSAKQFLTLSAVPYSFSGDSERSLILAIKDVTKRTQAENELVVSNARLNKTLESIKDGFFTVNRDWIVTYWNKEAEKLLGMEREFILGRNLWEVYSLSESPAERSQEIIFYKEYKRAMIKRVSTSFQGYFSTIDTWFDVNVYPAEDGISIYFKDITEQKRTESKKEHLMYVLGETVNEIYIFDSETLRFTYVNRGALLNIGYSMEEMTEMTPLDIKPEYDMHSFQEVIRPLKRGEKRKIIFETVHKRADESHYPVEVHLQLVQDGPKSVFVAIILDTTDRMRAEEDREKLIRELAQNNKDLRQFSYITSHNLRSPITNLISLTHLLENIPVENRELQEILDDVKSSTRNLNETIEDLTRILVIRENPSIKKEEVSFSNVFETVRHQVNDLVEKHEPRIVCDFREAPAIIYNRGYLESIFLNLITNAIKFRSLSRKLEIRISTEDMGEHVLLTFQDNGIGLEIDKYKTKLFGLYQKFHEHSESKGLGLYLVKTQVEALGGSIQAKSSPDQGMKILVRFKKH